jgi:hypothetical protein
MHFGCAESIVAPCWRTPRHLEACMTLLRPEREDARHRLPPRATQASASAFAAAFGGDPALLAAIRQQWQGPAATDDSDSAISRFDALGPVVQCPTSLLQSFGKGDDEKRVCGSPVEAPCTVVSIGSNNQWGFERAVAAAGPCHIHTLDCTVAATVPPGLRSRVTFHSICLGEEDHTQADGSRYLSWGTLVRKLGLATPPTMLKMDIEGFEWAVLESIVRSGSPLLPFSVSVELHAWTEVKEVPWQGRWRSVRETGAWMRGMLSRGGYALVDRHDNPLCSYCSEVVFARLLAPQPQSEARRSRLLRSHRRRRMHQEHVQWNGTRVATEPAFNLPAT